jgi:hypothetical protein
LTQLLARNIDIEDVVDVAAGPFPFITPELLAFNMVSILGEMILNTKIETQEKLEDFIERGGRDYSLLHMLKDKRFMELIREVKKEFDSGYKQFLYYH